MIVWVGMWNMFHPMGRDPVVKRNIGRKPSSLLKMKALFHCLKGKCRCLLGLRFCQI